MIDDLEKEINRLEILDNVGTIIILSLVIIGCCLYCIEESKTPKHQLREYQIEIDKLETENKIKTDTEAARLKLEQLRAQKLKDYQDVK